MYGQLSENFPKWEGLDNIVNTAQNIQEFLKELEGKAIDGSNFNPFDSFYKYDDNSGNLIFTSLYELKQSYIKIRWTNPLPRDSSLNNPEQLNTFISGYMKSSFHEHLERILYGVCLLKDYNIENTNADSLLEDLCKKTVVDISSSYKNYYLDQSSDLYKILLIFDTKMKYYLDKVYDIIDSYNSIIRNMREMDKFFDSFLDDITKLKTQFIGFKDGILNDFLYYVSVARGTGHILVLIYLSLLCTVTFFGGVLLILYACMKHQKPYILFMHIVWNSVRFFVFSFFMYGTAFGCLWLGAQDGIAYMEWIFGDNLTNENYHKLIPNNENVINFLTTCLTSTDTNIFSIKNKRFYNDTINKFISNYAELNEIFERFNYQNEFRELDSKRTEINNWLNNNDNKPSSLDNLINSINSFLLGKEKSPTPDPIKGKICFYSDNNDNCPSDYEDRTESIIDDLTGNDEFFPIIKDVQTLNNNYKYKLDKFEKIKSFSPKEFVNFLSKFYSINDCSTYYYYENVCTPQTNFEEQKKNIIKYLKKVYIYYTIKDDYLKLYDDIEEMYKNINNLATSTSDIGSLEKIKILVKKAKQKGGLFGSFDCGFLNNYLNIMKMVMYDTSIESRILCALSCCIGFFGAIAVYFLLWTMHHYDREIFKEGIKISGRPGLNKSTTRKIPMVDPSYKKKKIRSEIELTSRNEIESEANLESKRSYGGK